MKRRTMTRRQFVSKTAATAAGVALARVSGPALGALGANERIVVGSIGVGGQGSAHLHELATMQDVRVAALCDVDASRLDSAAKIVGGTPERFGDFRKLLERKDIDAVFIATPGHWHVIPALQACAAGKDVFVEKPVAHNIKEGKALLEAARKHKRVVQVGMQQRSTPHWINAVNRIRAGEIGKVSMVHVWNAWNTKEMFGYLGNPPDAPAPAGVDYDMWLGPAPSRPFNPLRFHGTHYFFWNYGGGMMSDWGIHLFDVVLWAMGPEITSVSTVGGHHVFEDARETPDTAVAAFECPGYTMTYTLRHGNGWQPHGGMDHGIEFFGTNTTLQINRNGFQICRDEDRGTRKPIYEEKGSTPIRDHERNFFDCIRSRAKPNGDVEAGYQGCIAGHLANISYRVGRRIHWDAEKLALKDDAEATKLVGVEYRTPWHI